MTTYDGREQVPLKDALVVLVYDYDTIATAFTDRTGNYDLGHFESVAGRRYRLYFSAPCNYAPDPYSEQPVINTSLYDREFVIDRTIFRKTGCYKPDNAAYFFHKITKRS